MAQTEVGRQMSLSLFAKNWAECNEQSNVRSAQSSALVSALESVSTGALSSARVSTVYHAYLSTLGKGDISTLSNRGHFYFGLTG